MFVHIYIHHFDRLVSIGAEPHANTLYKNFYYFVTEFNLVSTRELDALVSLKFLKDFKVRITEKSYGQIN